MNGAYSAEEVYTESDIQNVVQYAAAVRIPLYHYLSCTYGYVSERNRRAYSQCLFLRPGIANLIIPLGN